MPIARFQMPDGRIGRFEVPEGTSPEDAQSMISEMVANQPDFSQQMPEHPPVGDAFANGPLKIGAEGFPDALRSTLKDAGWANRNIASAGTALSNLWQGGKQLIGQGDQQAIEANRIIEQEGPIGAIAGNVAATAVPFGLAGNSLKAAAGVGAGFGLMNPVQGEQSAENIIKGKAMNTALGGVMGAGGQWVANKVISGVRGKLSGIEQRMAEKAAKVAESETASARGIAGNAAQNAYRQLEHLRELGANRALTASEQLTVDSLERELAEKALEKLMPAAAMKESTAIAYKEAMATEADRAAKYAAEKLSSNEVKQQIMARLKRYGPAAAGGMIGNLVLPGLGGAVGGAATGLVLRPAIRSMVNLSKNPAVQHGLLSPLKDSRLFTSPLLPTASLLAGNGLLGQ